MNSRERVLAALNHQEPDSIPFDLGGTTVTSISAVAYERAMQARNIPCGESVVHDMVFWGGGVNTQETLPRGTPQQV